MTMHVTLHNGRMVDATSSTHLSADRVAAFLDGRLTGVERTRAVQHLASCADCRRELDELRSVLASARGPRPSAWLTAGAALAAVLAFAVVMPRLMGNDSSNANVVDGRDLGGVRASGAVPTVQVLGPPDSAMVERSAVRLVWRAASANASYRVVVQDVTGTVVWEATRSDTSVMLPDSVRLVSGERYFWSVDARLGDGRSARTDVHRFTIR